METGKDRWTWDLSRLKVYTRKEFAYRWTYGRLKVESYAGGGGTMELDDKCWCRVIPRAHPWVRYEARKLMSRGKDS